MHARHFIPVIGALLAGLVIGGCASGSADMAYNYWLTAEEPLLEKGPYQQEPAARILPPGTRVRIISGGGAFTQVATVREETGWVPTASLRMQSSSDDNNYDGSSGMKKNYSGW
jgi:hypothetical protein